MSLMVIKNGDVYGAAKQRVISEIIAKNIWKNRFLDYVLDLGVNNIAGEANPTMLVDARFLNNIDPKMHEFLIEFLGMDESKLMEQWLSPETKSIYFALRGKQRPHGFDDNGFLLEGDESELQITPSVDGIEPIMSASIDALNQVLLGVDEIRVEMTTFYPYYSLGLNFETEAEAIANLRVYAEAGHVPITALKGFNQNSLNTWTTSSNDKYLSTLTLGGWSRGIFPAHHFSVRFFNAGVEVGTSVDSANMLYAEIIRLSDTMENSSSSSSVVTDTVRITTESTEPFKYNDSEILNTTSKVYWRASGLRETTHTYYATYNFGTILSEKTALINKITGSWGVVFPLAPFEKSLADFGVGDIGSFVPFKGTAVDYDNYITSGFEAQRIASEFGYFLNKDAIGDWLRFTEYGYQININAYRRTHPDEIMAVLQMLISIWIIRDKSESFWETTFGTILSMVLFMVVVYFTAFITIAYGAAYGGLFLGVAIAGFSAMGVSSVVIKMLMVANIALAAFTIGSAVYSSFQSIGTTTVTTTVTTPAGVLIDSSVATINTIPGSVSSTVVTPTVTAGVGNTLTTVNTVVNTHISVAMSITQNLAGGFSTISNLTAGLIPPKYEQEQLQEDTAGTQDEVIQYMFTSSYDNYSGMYHNYDEAYDFDRYFA